MAERLYYYKLICSAILSLDVGRFYNLAYLIVPYLSVARLLKSQQDLEAHARKGPL